MGRQGQDPEMGRADLPDYGSPRCVKAFIGCRLLSLLALATIIGLTAVSFYTINEKFPAYGSVSSGEIAMLFVTCYQTLYTAGSLFFFWDGGRKKTLMFTALLDGCAILTFTVLAICLGFATALVTPCYITIGLHVGADTNSRDLQAGLQARSGGLEQYEAMNPSNCDQVKTIVWLYVFLIVCFVCSFVLAARMWWHVRKEGKGGSRNDSQ